jgi:DNA-binding GntR family transcriptional regulator
VTDKKEPRFNPDGPGLVWVAIARDITDQIGRGELVPGGRLPSEAALAEHYGAARMTVRRALADLRTREIIETVFGKGTYVTSGALDVLRREARG